ncbi:MAG: hypothetical protein QXY49_03095 [Thermofilaceae archaeon]
MSVLKHYLRDDVAAEIADFARGRWLAIEGQGRDGRVFVRWWAGKPLTVSTSAEVKRLIKSFSGARVRAIYATSCVYHRIMTEKDVEDPGNIAAATLSWDIDATLEAWEAAIEAAKLIVDFLEKWRVRESVYLKWSGEGVHVHVHEAAISQNVLSIADPLAASKLLVEYTLRKLEEQLKELIEKWKVLKVENLMDPKRVFTVPLSFHRRVDKIAVCFKPDELDRFDPSWADPAAFKHDPHWRDNVPGEADQLAQEALRAFAHLQTPSARIGAAERLSRSGVELGRFQVMALLQAARYYTLTGDLEKAKSFGLNRAIFYAWAKRYGPSTRPRAGGDAARPRGGPGKGREDMQRAEILGEEVYISRDGWFVMGGVSQKPDDYDRQVVCTIESTIPYEEAWRRTLEYVRSFPRSLLENPQEFYNRVYEPVRDEFAEKVMKRKGQAETTLDTFFS